MKNNNSDKSYLPNLTGMVREPGRAAEFAEKNKVTLNISDIARDTARDVYNGLTTVTVRAPAKIMAKTAGSIMGLLSIPFGGTWAALQKGRKLTETAAESTDKLAWQG